MARQAEAIKFTGTIDDLCFYKMEGQYYVRMKSSLTGKKFSTHASFEGSRKSAKRFSEGNQLASKVYRMIEEEKRNYKLYCFLKRKAILLLKEDKSLQEAENILVDYLVDFGMMEKRMSCELSGVRGGGNGKCKMKKLNGELTVSGELSVVSNSKAFINNQFFSEGLLNLTPGPSPRERGMNTSPVKDGGG